MKKSIRRNIAIIAVARKFSAVIYSVSERKKGSVKENKFKNLKEVKFTSKGSRTAIFN